MADLPDLDTSQISFIAFWNAIDQGGVSSIDPEEALSHGSITEYTLYDNGWEGTFTLNNGRGGTVRVKADGWIIAYIDRTEKLNLNVGNTDNARGPWDVLSNWANSSGTDDNLDTNALERAINSLRGELSNSGSMSYLSSDVGLYDYWNDGAGEYVLFCSYASTTSSSYTFGYLHTGKTIHNAVFTAAVHGDNYDPRRGAAYWDPDDTNVLLCESESDYSTYVGALDLLESTTSIESGETEYKSSLSIAGDQYDNTAGTVTHLIWSSDA